MSKARRSDGVVHDVSWLHPPYKQEPFPRKARKAFAWALRVARAASRERAIRVRLDVREGVVDIQAYMQTEEERVKSWLL